MSEFIFIIFIAAIVDSVNPCALSILLLTIAFLFGLGQSRQNIIKVGSSYIAGIFLVYLFIGLGLLQALSLFNTPNFMTKVGAVILVIVGSITALGEIFPKFPVKLKIPYKAHHRIATLMERASVPAAFVLGGIVGLTEFPCTGGPYLAIIGMLHDSVTYLSGFGYLLFYNAIFILPLVIILALAGNRTVVARIRRWQKNQRSEMHLWTGLAMIILGVIIFII